MGYRFSESHELVHFAKNRIDFDCKNVKKFVNTLVFIILFFILLTTFYCFAKYLFKLVEYFYEHLCLFQFTNTQIIVWAPGRLFACTSAKRETFVFVKCRKIFVNIFIFIRNTTKLEIFLMVKFLNT